MLVLSRGETETINIFAPDGVPLGSVTVVAIRTMNHVRLGFDFPSNYRIMRSELVDDTLPTAAKSVE